MEEDGVKGAKLVSSLVEDSNRLLTSILIGNNIVKKLEPKPYGFGSNFLYRKKEAPTGGIVDALKNIYLLGGEIYNFRSHI